MALSMLMNRQNTAAIAAGGPGYIDHVSKRPAAPHGLGSTFRDWVAERTNYHGDLAEVALALRISNTVEAACRRGDMVEKRRAMMSDCTAFLPGGTPTTEVLPGG